VSSDVNRQHSSSFNWLRHKQKPVFCIPDNAGYSIKQAKQADFLDFRATEAEKRIILDLHNQLRQKVASGKEKRGSPGPQPAAAFMPDLVRLLSILEPIGTYMYSILNRNGIIN
jgi:hypothetical protein